MRGLTGSKAQNRSPYLILIAAERRSFLLSEVIISPIVVNALTDSPGLPVHHSLDRCSVMIVGYDSLLPVAGDAQTRV